MNEHLDGSGNCLLCKTLHAAPTELPDVRCWSPPCQPFSTMRWKGGSTPCTSDSASHPKFNISMEDILELTERSPASLTMIEQVHSFTKPEKHLHNKSPCQVVVEGLTALYGDGCVAAVSLDSKVWLEGSRPRP